MESKKQGKLKQWFGPSGLIALAVFVIGRLLLEPVRPVPQFDGDGMDPFGAVETFRLRKMPGQIETAVLGSSVTIWGIMPEVMAEELHASAETVRALGVAGGTPFEMWSMVRRNEEKFASLKLAILEVNPMVIDEDMEGDPRVEYDLCQRASLSERLMVGDPYERAVLVSEWLLPLQSVRRSLNSLFLNLADVERGAAICPKPDRRAYPLGGWKIKDMTAEDNMAKSVLKPAVAARRLIGQWRLSQIQDRSYRSLIAWLKSRNVAIVLHQMPVHPEVVDEMRKNKSHLESYAAYTDYVQSLGIPPEAVFQHLEISECGVPRKGMRDHTHFNEIGALAYSTHLAKKIREWRDGSPKS